MAAELLRGLGTLKSLSRANVEPTAPSACRICGSFPRVKSKCLISKAAWVGPGVEVLLTQILPGERGLFFFFPFYEL